MSRVFCMTTCYFFFAVSTLFGQTDSLKSKILQVLAAKKADVGVAIYGIESGDTLSINGTRHFPMQSVFKFPIAWAILNKVDEGKFSLGQKIHIEKNDLLSNTWSPIREKYPEGNIDLPLAQILEYTVSESDNNGCDILFRLIGGPKIVNDFVHNLGVKEIAIEVNEEEMHKSWEAQFRNWTTPIAAAELLKIFYQNNVGGKNTKPAYQFLWEAMLKTSTGQNRIKGQLPAGTLVAHKTGSSGKNRQGISAAVNDIGIVTLPNGTHFAIAVFVSNSKEPDAVNEKIISDISKLVWDYFVDKTK